MTDGGYERGLSIGIIGRMVVGTHTLEEHVGIVADLVERSSDLRSEVACRGEGV